MVDIEFVYDEGGVTTPAGFRASGVHAGFRKDPKRLDAALVVSDGPDTVSCGMFTRNVFCAAPVQLDREVSCRAAIKAGDHTSPQELMALAEKILSGEVPPFCPHGRPCVLKLTRKELEKQFGRIV